jgi:hypothetical protein
VTYTCCSRYTCKERSSCDHNGNDGSSKLPLPTLLVRIWLLKADTCVRACVHLHSIYTGRRYEQEALVELLIAEAGTDVAPKDYVDKENNNGVTPLMAAARDGFTAIVLKLLAAGADYAQVDEFGRTADSVADEKGFPETCAAVKEWAEAHPK